MAEIIPFPLSRRTTAVLPVGPEAEVLPLPRSENAEALERARLEELYRDCPSGTWCLAWYEPVDG